MPADLRSVVAVLRSRTGLVILIAALLLTVAGAVGYATYTAQEARRQEQERQLEQRLRIETRQKLLALQRQEADLLRQDQIKQQLAAEDTARFQRDTLQSDLQKQEREVRILRREAAERQAKLVAQERERRKKEVDQLVREDVKTELEKSDSAACIQAYDNYKRKKTDPTTSAAEVKTSLSSLRELCNSKDGPAGG